ncbi:MAG TPA: TIM barrel protein [Planctomycetota bacterium]|nr:TIM barrel protein [Planctomycetota bacterium]
MKLLMFRSMWGILGPWGKYPATEWEQAFPQVKAAGYHGIETRVPEPAQRKRFQKLLAAHKFQYIAMIFTAGTTVEEHLASFEKQVHEAASLKPKFIVSHSGRDAFSPSEADDFFARALEIETKAKIQVAHETHRGRILFNPWSTERVLKQFSELKLCCDFSHFVCVAERLLGDCDEIIDLCGKHCLHIHARVGYEEGPQVPDPRAPEYAHHLKAHEKWWNRIWDLQQAAGRKETTMDPEFGPPGYLHTLPNTNVPVADLWDICNWQAQRQTENFLRRKKK